MGLLVDVTSKSFLLQREDFPGALAALHALAREGPGEFHHADNVLAAQDLPAALRAADWAAELDEHGDVVALDSRSDKIPRDAAEGWPARFLDALAPHARHGVFRQWVELDPAIIRHTFRNGVTYIDRYEAGLEIVPGPVPRCRPGEKTTVGFEVRAREPRPIEVEVEVTHSTQIVNSNVETRVVRPGEPGRLGGPLMPGAADAAELFAMIRVNDADQGQCALRVDVETPPGEADAVHDVVASVPLFNRVEPEPFLLARDLDRALEYLRRYARRHQDRPGAAFLAGVAAAGDLPAAFHAAGLDPRFTEAGLVELVFGERRLPGPERYLAGLFWSLRGLIGEGGFRLAYPHLPKSWVCIAFEWGLPARNLMWRE